MIGPVYVDNIRMEVLEHTQRIVYKVVGDVVLGWWDGQATIKPGFEMWTLMEGTTDASFEALSARIVDLYGINRDNSHVYRFEGPKSRYPYNMLRNKTNV